MAANKDLTGQKFGRLKVLSRIKGILYLCECDCKKLTRVRSCSLTAEKIRSCGCLRDEAARRTGLNQVKHGQAIQRSTGRRETPEYRAWASMKTRCLNPKIRNWHRYGGRGISIFPAWIDDFPAFFAYVGKRPSDKHSLDRYPDSDGDYEPGNVRWATAKKQQNNKSKKVAA